MTILDNPLPTVTEGWLYSKLLRLTKARAPREVGGLIIDDNVVVELTNLAEGNNSFEFRLEEIRTVIDSYNIYYYEVADRVTLWHSHPGGGIGPSREDMKRKTPLKRHLVVALVDGDIIPTWY